MILMSTYGTNECVGEEKSVQLVERGYPSSNQILCTTTTNTETLFIHTTEYHGPVWWEQVINRSGVSNEINLTTRGQRPG